MCNENQEFLNFYKETKPLWNKFFELSKDLEFFVVPAEHRLRSLFKTDKTILLEKRKELFLIFIMELTHL